MTDLVLGVVAVFWAPALLALISACFETRYGDYTDAAVQR